MKAVSNIKQRPTFSFCEKTQNEFNGHYSTPQLNESFDQPMGCRIIYLNNTKTIYCAKLTRIVESVTPFSHRCLTYFSQLLDKNASLSEKIYLNFIISNNFKAFAIIHESGTPPHFSRDKIQISKSSAHQIDFSSIITNLMPFPYSTDCYDYKQELNSRILCNSREDCFLKHIERREIDEWGCNKR
jgi:hypothetical protein